MASTSDTILNDARCLECSLAPGMVWFAILAAIDDLANGRPVPTDAQTLMDEASCFICKLHPAAVPYAILQALVNLSTGGGIGGGGVSRGTGSPEGVVTSASAGGIYYDCATNKVWVFCGTAGTNTGWQSLIN